ncbi:MFS transporter [bacterium]|nr:MFS transporter [bacterium]
MSWNRRQYCVLLCFFLSGMTGLIYEIVWIRQLGLVFGGAAPSVGLVLGSYMLGLGLGALVLGRWADRVAAPLAIFGLIEGLVGLYGLGFGPLLGLMERLYLGLPGLMSPRLYLVKAVLSFLLLLFPTFLMGGTLPLVSKFWIQQRYQLRTGLGLLYGVNTAGAVMGAALTGYCMLGWLGLSMTTRCAAMINGLIIVIVIFLSRSNRRAIEIEPKTVTASIIHKDKDIEEEPDIQGVARISYSAWQLKIIFFLLFCSGFTSLAYEVGWTRFFTVVLGNTSYGLASVLVAYLSGISLGSWLATRRMFETTTGENKFVVLQIIIALSSLVLHMIIGSVPALIAGQFEAYGLSFWLLQLIQALFIMYFLLVPATCYGYLFPVVADLLVNRMTKLGQSIGWLYLVNTIGATFGSLLMTFILVPLVGLDNSISIIICLNIALAGVMLLLIGTGAKQTRRLWTFVCASTLVVSTIIMVMPQDGMHQIHIGRIPDGWQIQHIYEDIEATVAIATGRDQSEGVVRRLYMNGNPSASGLAGPIQVERLESLLPLLLHPDPKSLLVIGFGSGITAGAARDFSLETIDAVEIVSDISIIAHEFVLENRHINDDPRLTLSIEDGRQYLKRVAKGYDVITTGPQHPTQVGSVHLYTREYFRDCAMRLNDQGIMAQWIPLYQFAPNDVLKVLTTMHDVFPYISLWSLNHDLIVLAKKSNTPISFESLERHWQDRDGPLGELLKQIGMTLPFSLYALFITSDPKRLVENPDKIIISDDFPSIEFSSLPAINQDTVPANIELLINLLSPLSQGIPAFLNYPEDTNLKERAIKIINQRPLYYQARLLHQTGQLSESQMYYIAVMKTYPFWPNLMRDLNNTTTGLIEQSKKNRDKPIN